MSDSLTIRMAKQELEKFARDYPDMKPSKQFELFTSFCAIKKYDFDSDCIDYSLVGDGGDGGIDWIHVVANDTVLDNLEEPDISQIPKNCEIKFIFGQAKEEKGFKASVANSMLSTFMDNFNEGNEPPSRKYNSTLTQKLNELKEFWQVAVTKRPRLEIEINYSTLSDRPAHEDVKSAFKITESGIEKLFDGAKAHTKFTGATDLYSISNSLPSYDSDLKYQDELDGASSKVALVKLSDYYEFLTDDDGQLNQHFFEDNVRDFEGKVEVNKNITATLQSESKTPDFWWLNNGITILVSEAPVSRTKMYSLRDVQIVNGLQTSRSIFDYFSENPDRLESENRSVLVRILTPQEEAEKDRIIRATNSQTNVSIASLRSTDPVHREIEGALKLHSLYYDRRKNYWKNQGVSPKRIISIVALSQAVISAFLDKPDTARARPSSFLKIDSTYEEIFKDRNLEDFVWAARNLKNIELILSQNFTGDQGLRNNLKFYVLMACRALGHCIETDTRIWKSARCPSDFIPSASQITEITNWIHGLANDLATKREESLDKICKGSELKSNIAKEWSHSKVIKAVIEESKQPH